MTESNYALLKKRRRKLDQRRMSIAPQPTIPTAQPPAPRTLWSKLMNSSRFFYDVLGITAILIVAGFAYNQGWITQLADQIPKPPPAEPVTIAIQAPQPGEVIMLVSNVIVADVSGPAGVPKWSAVPAGAGDFSTATGKIVRFTAKVPGKVTLQATVGGDGKQVATSQVELNSLATGPPPAPVDPNPVPATPPPAPQPQTQTVSEVISAQVAQVSSDNKVAEALKLANTITAVMGQITGKLLPPSQDITGQIANLIEDQASIDLGSAAVKWNLVLSAIAVVLDTFENQGQLRTLNDALPVLTEIRTVLLQTH